VSYTDPTKALSLQVDKYVRTVQAKKFDRDAFVYKTQTAENMSTVSKAAGSL
jgi:hypothetical protein